MIKPTSPENPWRKTLGSQGAMPGEGSQGKEAYIEVVRFNLETLTSHLVARSHQNSPTTPVKELNAGVVNLIADAALRNQREHCPQAQEGLLITALHAPQFAKLREALLQELIKQNLRSGRFMATCGFFAGMSVAVIAGYGIRLILG